MKRYIDKFNGCVLVNAIIIVHSQSVGEHKHDYLPSLALQCSDGRSRKRFFDLKLDVGFRCKLY